MRKSPYFKQIMIVISFIALFLCGAIYTNRFFNTEIVHQQETKLSQKIDLYLALFDNPDDLRAFIEAESGLKETERMTLLDAKGLIIYDSTSLAGAVGQREDRPEIKKILTDDYSVSTELRESKTLGERLLYVAKPIYHEEELVGIIRLAETYQGFSQGIRQFQLVLLIGFAILVGALVSLLFYFIKQSEAPLRYILPALRQIEKHPEQKQELDLTSPEWNELYTAVNQLMRETNQLYYQQLFSEEKLQFILENLNLGVFILNDQLEVVSANPVIEELFPVEGHQENLFGDATLARLVGEIKVSGQEIQEEINTSHGKHLKVVLRLLQANQSAKKEYVGIVYDLTALRKMEQIHQDFISNISHELKTPTTSIIGFSETLLSGALNNRETAEEFVGIIQVEAERLAALIQNILLLLRTETSYLDFDLTSVSPISILDEELSRYQSLIHQKELKVSFAIEISKNILVPADYFQPIVKNLLENAINYSEPHGQIHLALRKKEGQLIFAVTDTGIGIAPEEQQRIFERFYRVSKSRERHSGGSGLGLAIVSHYTDLLEGRITVDSQLGSGTKITINWPQK